MLRVQGESAVMYGGQLGESHELQVNSPEEDAKALAEGCHELRRPAELPVWRPKRRSWRILDRNSLTVSHFSR